jgi:hypothetical protein
MRSLIPELALGLFISIGDPEMVITIVKIGQIGHLFKMPTFCTNQSNIYFRFRRWVQGFQGSRIQGF